MLDIDRTKVLITDSIIKKLLLFGYEIEVFGDDEIVLRSVPAALISADFVSPLVEFLEIGSDFINDNNVYKTLACKAAVKSRSAISIQEVKEMLSLILLLDDPLHCPHGRPTTILVTIKEIEKMFKRRN